MVNIHLIHSIYSERGPLLDEINTRCIWHAFHRRRTLELLRPYLKHGCRILDLACGTGILARSLIGEGAHVTLVDVLPGMIELARQHLGPSPSAKFVCADITRLSRTADIAQEAFDIVLWTQAANFVDDLDPVVRFAQSHLRPGGVFHLDIDTAFRWMVIEALAANVENAAKILHCKRDVARNIVGTEYFFHEVEDLQKLLAAAGLTVGLSTGILFLSCLLHVYNRSADFLKPGALHPHVRKLLEESRSSELWDLDKSLEGVLPTSAGGWIVLQAFKPEI